MVQQEEDENNEQLDPVPRSVEQIKEKISDSAAAYIADLNTLTLPASTVQRCVEASKELIDDIICSIEEVVSPI